MKLDQLCFYAAYEWQSDEIKTMLSLNSMEWVQDTVTMLNRFPPSEDWQVAVAELNFCDTLGPQVEIMRYLQGPHWNVHRDKSNYFIGHIGLHLADDDEWPPMTGGMLVQETRTIGHTAPPFNDPNSPQFMRRYHYRIYRMPRGENIHIKLIRRMHHVST